MLRTPYFYSTKSSLTVIQFLQPYKPQNSRVNTKWSTKTVNVLKKLIAKQSMKLVVRRSPSRTKKQSRYVLCLSLKSHET